ncbi:hypothetical protein DRQ25_06465 [Candidatus Fermentibacteria bacterium]|nr:MAG: hypothetical protein DRQ25_06465 [Candidatus Fermentibacteria bacterium]
MLLRISLSDEKIITVVSTSPGEASEDIPAIAGNTVAELFSTWPLSEDFEMVQFTPGSETYSAAARMDSDSSVLVYYLDIDEDDLYNPSIPVIRLIPDRSLPMVSPGFVCLLGYTPWELAQSELISSLPGDSRESRGQVTLLDKTGRGLRLIFSRTPNRSGGTDYTFISRPEGLLFPVRELKQLAQMKVQVPEDLLAFLVDVLKLEAAVLLTRSTVGYVPICTVNVEIDTEHFETSSIFNPENLQFPIWVDLDEDRAPLSLTGQCLVYPSGQLVLVAPWRGDADTLQQRADSIMPALSMKYEYFRTTHGEHRLQNLLSELDLLLADQSDQNSLQNTLEVAATGFSATVLAIFGPEESATPVASSNTDNEIGKLLVSDRPFEECFNDTHVSILNNGFILLAAWNDEREVPYKAIDDFGKKLNKIDLDQLRMDDTNLPDFSQLQAVFMKDTKVLWHGRSLGISHCFQFYGNSRQCFDCPVDHLSVSGKKSARLENHQGYVEEIYPTGKGYLITWTLLPSEGVTDSSVRESYPGGEAEYTPDGEIVSWNGWFQEATGVGSEQVSGQNAARILNRIGSPVLLSQYRAALAGIFIPEPVEFVWKGMKCFSRMRTPGPGENILHTVLDSNRAGIADATTLGPGSLSSSSEPRSLAEYLSIACRREGWEFDISGTTSEEGAPVWFARRAATDLLSSLLHILAPMCPDRWAGLETGWLDNTPQTGAFSFLPGQYHVIQFRLQGIGIAERSSILRQLSILFRGFGGWLAGSPDKDVLQVGLPAGKKHYKEIDAIIYSPLSSFTELYREAISGIKSKKFHVVESAREMAVRQQTAGAVICRLDQSNIHYATALAARIPDQPILVASGLSSGIPSITTKVRHLQLPVDRKTLLSAIRKTLRG